MPAYFWGGGKFAPSQANDHGCTAGKGPPRVLLKMSTCGNSVTSRLEWDCFAVELQEISGNADSKILKAGGANDVATEECGGFKNRKVSKFNNV